MIAEPAQCARLDECHGFLPGTMAMRLLAGDVTYRQTTDHGWFAEPAIPVDSHSSTGGSPLRGFGSTPEAAMANLWARASSGVQLKVFPPRGSGRKNINVRWDPERGWSTPR